MQAVSFITETFDNFDQFRASVEPCWEFNFSYNLQDFSIVAEEMPPTQFPPVDFDESLPPETPQSPIGPPNENSREFWLSSGQAILQEALTKKMNQNVAKNLIILVADGMSIPTQTAARMYMGGEEKVLSFEEFPYVGLAKVSLGRKVFALNNETRKSFPMKIIHRLIA